MTPDDLVRKVCPGITVGKLIPLVGMLIAAIASGAVEPSAVVAYISTMCKASKDQIEEETESLKVARYMSANNSMNDSISYF